MALSNMDKDVTTRLFEMLALRDSTTAEISEAAKTNYSQYAQLNILAEQMNNLRVKAQEIINNIEINKRLHEIQMHSKKVGGSYYYHYLIDDREILSIIAPHEWTTYTTFYGKYYYGFDNIFYKID